MTHTAPPLIVKMCVLIANKILENIFLQEKCFVFMTNYVGKIKSFYHVL